MKNSNDITLAAKLAPNCAAQARLNEAMNALRVASNLRSDSFNVNPDSETLHVYTKCQANRISRNAKRYMTAMSAMCLMRRELERHAVDISKLHHAALRAVADKPLTAAPDETFYAHQSGADQGD
jgi:hypothetical protein